MMFDDLDDAYPLSPLQQGMLYEALKHPDHDVYVAYIVIDIIGNPDSDVLFKAWQSTVSRYPALRTRFLWEELDEPLQLVSTQPHMDWTHCELPTDSAELHNASCDAIVDYWLAVERDRPLSLSDSPPTRFRLIDLPQGRQSLIWTVHHMLADDWSTPIVLQHVADCYASIDSNDDDVPNTPPEFNYSEYLDWLTQSAAARHVDWWESTLREVRPTPMVMERVVTESARPARSQHVRYSQTLTPEHCQAIDQLLQRSGCTLSSLMHAAWALVVARYAGTQDALFGTSVSGRSCALPHITEAVGLFLNTLPTPVRFIQGETSLAYINRVQRQLFEQLEHEHVPIAQLSKLLDKQAQDAPFDTVLVVEAHGTQLQIDSPDASLSFGSIRYTTDSNFPLTVLVFPDEPLMLQLVASEAHFCPQSLQAICAELSAVIQDLCSPELLFVDALMQRQEQRMQAHYTGPAWVAPNAFERIDEWIVSAVDSPPDQTAVIDNGCEFSYQQLFDLAGSIQKAIEPLEAGSGYIGLCLDRSVEQIAAILAVLGAGYAYVPIDCRWPADRIRQIVADARLSIILTTDAHSACCESSQCQLVDVEQLDQACRWQPAAEFANTGITGAAYMIYTSGSTGRPKGVSVSHRHLIYSTAARMQHYGAKPARYLLQSPYSFDSSVAGIFWTLCSAGTLVLPGPATASDVHHLESQIARYSITHTLCLPSLHALLLRFANPVQLRSLQCVIVAGESCPASLAQLHSQLLPATELFNEYGPTEATVWATVARLNDASPLPGGLLPIGQAIAGTTVTVVDACKRCCPPGVAGELLIHGPGVVSGYHGDQALSRQRFDGNTYLSGDRAVAGFDRQLYYLGRMDDQIKVRGHRIEPAEIAACVLAEHSIAEAYCCLLPTGANDTEPQPPSLACFYTVRAEPTAATDATDDCHLLATQEDKRLQLLENKARDRLQAALPAYCKVDHFVALSCMPRLPNGKVDRSGLPQPAQLGDATSEPGRQVTPTGIRAGHTEALCSILAQLLNRESVAPDSNFFAIGGDSLTAIRFVATCREQGIPLTIPMVSIHDSLHDMGNALELENSPSVAGTPIAHTGLTPLTPIQRWFLRMRQPDPAHWNMAFVIELSSVCPAATVIGAIKAVLDQHPVLASRFVPSDEMTTTAPQDSAQAPDSLQVHIDEQPDFAAAIQTFDERHGSVVDQLMDDQHGFDLRRGRLIRCRVVCDETGLCQTIGVVVHHLVTDAVSNWQLARCITDRIQGEIRVDKPGLSASSYRQWALLVAQHYGQKGGSTAERVGTAHRCRHQVAWIEGNVTERSLALDATMLLSLTDVARQAGMELPVLLLQVILQGLRRPHPVRVDVETHGRDSASIQLDTSASVGWYTGFFTLTCAPERVKHGADFSAYFAQQKRHGLDQFATGPEDYFDTDTRQVSATSMPAVLYNFLALNGSHYGTERAATGDDFTLHPLVDHRLRAANSRRSHAIDVLVTDLSDGINLVWRVDSALAISLNLQAWIDDVDISLHALVRNTRPEARQSVSRDFPDSGLSDDELDHFLANLE